MFFLMENIAIFFNICCRFMQYTSVFTRWLAPLCSCGHLSSDTFRVSIYKCPPVSVWPTCIYIFAELHLCIFTSTYLCILFSHSQRKENCLPIIFLLTNPNGYHWNKYYFKLLDIKVRISTARWRLRFVQKN